MKTFILTYNRPYSITSHLAFPDAKVVVHNEKQADLYAETVNPDNIIISNAKTDDFGKVRQQEWVMNKFVKKGEWFIFADDDIKRLTAVPKQFYDILMMPVQEPSLGAFFRDIFKTRCTPEYFDYIAKDTIAYAEKVNARMCAFPLLDNHFYRGKKYRTVGYCAGGLILLKNDDIKWDYTVTMEDFQMTADHLLRFGSVVINNYVCPNCGYYNEGGLGTYEERVPARLKDVKTLMGRFPDMFRIKDRKEFVKNSDVQVRLTSPEQVYKWRLEMQRKGLYEE